MSGREGGRVRAPGPELHEDADTSGPWKWQVLIGYMPTLHMAGQYLRQGKPRAESIALVGCGDNAVVRWWRRGRWMTQQSIGVRESQRVFVEASEATHRGDVEFGVDYAARHSRGWQGGAKAMPAGRLSEV